MAPGQTYFVCEPSLWNSNSLWNSDYPVFTQCFQDIVLAWIPSVVLCLGVFMCCFSTNGQKLNKENKTSEVGLTLTLFTTTRYIGIIGLLALYILLDIYCWRYDRIILFIAYLIKTLNCVIAFCILFRNDWSGESSVPTVLGFFWFVLLFCNGTSFGSLLKMVISGYYSINTIKFSSAVLENILILINSASVFHDDYLQANVLMRVKLNKNLFHSYYATVMSSTIWNSSKKIVQLENLMPLTESVQSKMSFQSSVWAWSQYLKCNSRVGNVKRSMSMGILKLYWKPLAICFFLASFQILLRSFSIAFLILYIRYISLKQPTWLGITYAFCIFSTECIFNAAFDYNCQLSRLQAIKLKWHLMYLVFKKSLYLRIDSTSDLGSMINYAAIDVDNIFAVKDKIAIILFTPAAIFISVVYLWIYLGPSSLTGWSLCLALLPFVSYMSFKAKILQEKCMELKDERLKLIKEILHFIKTIKCFTWETVFIKRVESIRKEEEKLLVKLSYCTAVIRFFSECIPCFVSVFCFLAFTFLRSAGHFNAEVVFVTMAVLGTLKLSMNILPDIFTIFVQLSVSFNRLQMFLASDKLNISPRVRKFTEASFVNFKDVTVSYSDIAQPILKHISVSLSKGQLAVVVGSVGSGKSSFLEAILGNMVVKQGTVKVKGSTAYVPQESFILNDTFRENVIFGKKFDKERFDRTINFCCLRTDLEQFSLGEFTEIGERGITLSGGQRQRLSLARAVYRDSDIYILDDALSAVDVRVRSKIFDGVIGPTGVLKDKLRIFATTEPSFVLIADIIIFVNEGTVKIFESYTDFVHIYGDSAIFICKYTTKDVTTEDIKNDTFVDILDRNHSNTKAHDCLADEETAQKGRISSKIYLNFLKHIGVFPGCLISINYISYQGLQLISGLWLKDWANNSDKARYTDLYYTVVYCILGIGQGITFLIGSALLFKRTVKAGSIIHERMLSSLLRAPVKFFDCNTTGRILNRFGKDLDQIDVILPDTVNRTFTCSLEVLGILILISARIPVFSIVALITLTVLTIYNKFYMKTIRQMQRLEAITRSPVYSLIAECADGLASIRAYNAEKQFLKSFNEKMKINLNCWLNLSYSSLWYISRGNTIACVVTGIVVLLITLMKDSMTPGESGLLISYAINFTAMMAYAILYTAQLDSCFVAAERLEEYCSIQNEGEWSLETNNTETSKGQIVTRNFAARYREGLDPVLRDINLEILPGEKVGIVGRTGAGKSSLVLSLYHFLERTNGNIKINNRSTCDIGLHDLRSALTIIPQNPAVFSGTLRFNLDPGNKYSDSELYMALESVYLKDSFQDGLSTCLSTSGGKILSAGQRQLMCLARALLTNPSILVLDEATASLDLDTDYKIQKVIKEKFSDCTVLKIAHRIHSVLDCNTIIVMDSGRIVEEGPLENLLKDGSSLFKRLADQAQKI